MFRDSFRFLAFSLEFFDAQQVDEIPPFVNMLISSKLNNVPHFNLACFMLAFTH